MIGLRSNRKTCSNHSFLSFPPSGATPTKPLPKEGKALTLDELEKGVRGGPPAPTPPAQGQRPARRGVCCVCAVLIHMLL